MAIHKYTYKGKETVNLPLHGITAIGGDNTKIYRTDTPIKHPDFHEIKDHTGKERKPAK